ncbi:TfoX/Sxy family protein [Nocardioides sp. SYSU D00038]|uniref:TfoX/Sxy family protein n=1 Tax=Nocardioides sp. SYSU D00038 TaxID=2812554 RepID=UPI0019689055|nr:TfoX/Sxy family protein [Nocardioides sp. SYSU D00038]
MAYDEELAERVRGAVSGHGPAQEKRMFGGLGFLLGGHLAVCVSDESSLLVRVPAPDQAALVAADGVEPMRMGERTSRTWVRVDEEALRDDEALAAWVARGVAVVTALPPK